MIYSRLAQLICLLPLAYLSPTRVVATGLISVATTFFVVQILNKCTNMV